MSDRGAAHESVLGSGRLRTAYRSWQPPAPRAALLIVHGLADHGGRYADFAAVLAARGIAVYAPDLRGHGRTPGQRGHVDSFDTFLAQLDTVRRHAESQHPGVPFFILGQSMGGLVVIRYLQEFAPPAGAVLCSPWLATAMPVAAWKLRLAPLLARALPRLPFPHGMDASDLTRDPQRVAAYRADPLVHGRITPATYAAVTDAMSRARQHVAALQTPLLVLLSGADRIVGTDAAAAFFRALPADRVAVRIRPGRFHELLQETDRQQTTEEIAAWLESRL